MDYDISTARSHYLYKCNSDGVEVTAENTCAGSCEKGNPSRCKSTNCKPGGFYCGAELVTMYWDAARTVADRLYKCDSVANTATGISLCTKCINNAPSSWCHCVPGSQYCGRELVDKFGWRKENEYEKTISKCIPNGTSSTFVQTCKHGCFGNSPNPSCAKLPCSTGALYCGRELMDKGWSEDEYSSQVLYKCSGDTLSAVRGESVG